MATTSLTERLQALSVADTSAQARTKRMCLPFNPGEDFESARVRSGQVDRYLYRLYDKYSDGSTDSVRVRSKDACRFRKSSYVDIFARADRDVTAQALRRHLQWEGKPDDEDNFVSWTSSLLLVLQYAFYREQYYANLDFAEINICVVDTSLMPTGVFMNDMALIEAFSRYDSTGYKSLAGLKTLRQSKYYFGEYLSQGTLSIDGCCSVVSMRQIMNDGLGLLRPEFLEAEASNGQWANRVVALREMFRISGPHCDARVIEVDAALQIGKRFGTSWQVPIALAFLALKPRRSWDETIIKAFRKLYDTGYELTQLSSERMGVVLHDALPEVQQFDRLIRCGMNDFLIRMIAVKCDKFKDELQHAHQLLELITPGSGHQSLLESLSVAVQATDAINEELSSKQSLKVS